MRSLEKGLLLAELCAPNSVSREHLDSFIDWIREQDCYKDLYKNMLETKKSSSIVAKYLYSEYASLNLDAISSIEEGIIIYSKILFLCNYSKSSNYINPLLIIEKKEEKVNVGEISIKFNNKIITLDELSTLEGYNFLEKYEAIKNKVSEWEEDVYSKLNTVLESLKDHPRNLPKRKVMTPKFIIALLYLVILDIVGCLFVFSNNDKIRNIVTGQNLGEYIYLNYFFIAFISILILLNITILCEFVIKKIVFHKYNSNRNKLISKPDTLVKELSNNSDKLLEYISKNVSDGAKMDVEVSNFSSCTLLYKKILYLYNINYRYKKFKKVKMLKINAFLLIVLTICFILCASLSLLYFWR